MRQEIGLDESGAPVVRAFRSDEGQLVFRYLTVRAGGMAVWLDVEELSTTPQQPPGDLPGQIRDASLVVADAVRAGESERTRKVGDLEAQVAELGEALAEANAQIAQLRRGQGGSPGRKPQRRAGKGAAA